MPGPCRWVARPALLVPGRLTLAARGYEHVFEGDIAACFDEISHPPLMDRRQDRVGERRVLALSEAFLKAGSRRVTRLRDTLTGTPQGGILAPLLANKAIVDESTMRTAVTEVTTE